MKSLRGASKKSRRRMEGRQEEGRRGRMGGSQEKEKKKDSERNIVKETYRKEGRGDIKK